MTCDDRHRCRARYCFLPRLSHGGARLNSGEVKPAQSGEQMAPDNFIPSLPILLGANVPLTSSNARTLRSHSPHPPPPQPPLKPKAWQSLSRCSYLRNLSLLHLPPSVPCLPHICIPPKVHFSMTNHMGFQQSFKVCCLWETLFSVQHFSIQGNT